MLPGKQRLFIFVGPRGIRCWPIMARLLDLTRLSLQWYNLSFTLRLETDTHAGGKKKDGPQIVLWKKDLFSPSQKYPLNYSPKSRIKSKDRLSNVYLTFCIVAFPLSCSQPSQQNNLIITSKRFWRASRSASCPMEESGIVASLNRVETPTMEGRPFLTLVHYGFYWRRKMFSRPLMALIPSVLDFCIAMSSIWGCQCRRQSGSTADPKYSCSCSSVFLLDCPHNTSTHWLLVRFSMELKVLVVNF